MNEVVIQNLNLPTTIEDLSKFVLVGREKLTSVRAEIRAIDKLQLAEEVRNQKREEALMLSEALLDAEVRLGDLLSKIPKDRSFKGNQWQSDTTVDLPKANTQRPKKEVIQELGFTQKQAERFETLAKNKDLVEQVKQEARENEDIPTRSRVLDLAQQRKKQLEESNKRVDEAAEIAKYYISTIGAVSRLKTDSESMELYAEALEENLTIDNAINRVDEAIGRLQQLKMFLSSEKNGRGENGKTRVIK